MDPDLLPAGRDLGLPPPLRPRTQAPKHFDDFVAPTKILYVGDTPATIHLRKCRLSLQGTTAVGGPGGSAGSGGESYGLSQGDFRSGDHTALKWTEKIL